MLSVKEKNIGERTRDMKSWESMVKFLGWSGKAYQPMIFDFDSQNILIYGFLEIGYANEYSP